MFGGRLHQGRRGARVYRCSCLIWKPHDGAGHARRVVECGAGRREAPWFIDAPCSAPAMSTGAWRVATGASAPLIKPEASVVDDPPPPPVPGDLEDTERAVKAIRAACEAVLKAEAELTALDEKVGDGDAGTTLAAGAKAVLEACDAGLPKGASGVAAAVARAVEDSMGGSSGVLYNLGLKAAETSLRQSAGTRVPADKAWCDAYVAFAEAITQCGGAGVGSRTMCDATLPAADVFRKGGTLAEAAAAARRARTRRPRSRRRTAGRRTWRRRRSAASSTRARAPWRSRSRPSRVPFLPTPLAREHGELRWSMSQSLPKASHHPTCAASLSHGLVPLRP